MSTFDRGFQHVQIQGRAEASRVFPDGSAHVGADTTFVNAAAVRALKERLNGIAAGLNAAINQCAFPVEQKVAWDAFDASWEKFYKAEDSGFLGFGTGAIFSEGQAYELQLQKWAEIVNTTCKTNVPTATSHPGSDVQDPEGAKGPSVFSRQFFSSPKFVIAATLVGVGILGLGVLAVRQTPAFRILRGLRG